MIKFLDNKYDKKDVTDKYIQVLKKSISKMKFEYLNINDIKKIEKHDIVFTTNIDDAFKVLLLKKSKIINWYQGIRPEESFSKNKSLIRKIVLNKMEKFVLKKATLNIFVSNGMKAYYREKYSYYDENDFIMPCFNTRFNSIDRKKFNQDKIYFSYVGGLSNWQCIEETLKLFKAIENINPNVYLKFLTPNVSQAQQMIEECGIRNFEVKYVDNSKLSDELKNVKYGFLIRKEDPINYVATPTKLSTYLSNGIIPITTTSIYDINHLMKNKKYRIFINLEDDINDIAKFIINSDEHFNNEDDMINEYKEIFNNYYNEDLYVNELLTKLSERISK